MNPHQVIQWTNELVDELREMAKTMPAGQIAKIWHVTRNTICGKMARVGIKRPERMAPLNPKRMKPPPKPPQIERKSVISYASLKPMPLPGPHQMPHQAPAEAADEIFPTGTDIWQLTSNTCRYPLWRDNEPISEKLYCGGAAVEGLPYCDACAKIAYSGWDTLTHKRSTA